MTARSRAKPFLAAVLGDWCYYSLCPVARNRRPEKFSNVPKVTQPNLESQVSPGICRTPSLGRSPGSVRLAVRVLSRGGGTAGAQLSGDGPASLLKSYKRGMVTANT